MASLALQRNTTLDDFLPSRSSTPAAAVSWAKQQRMLLMLSPFDFLLSSKGIDVAVPETRKPRKLRRGVRMDERVHEWFAASLCSVRLCVGRARGVYEGYPLEDPSHQILSRDIRDCGQANWREAFFHVSS